MSFMKYKGYRAKIEYEEEDQIFHGVVVNILDTISFYGKSVDELTDAFRESVDGYIAFSFLFLGVFLYLFFFFQAEDGIRDKAT